MIVLYCFTQKTLGIDDVSPLENTIIISKYKNELKIKSETESIERITVLIYLEEKFSINKVLTVPNFVS
jgi:hypothetical protein